MKSFSPQSCHENTSSGHIATATASGGTSVVCIGFVQSLEDLFVLPQQLQDLQVSSRPKVGDEIMSTADLTIEMFSLSS